MIKHGSTEIGPTLFFLKNGVAILSISRLDDYLENISPQRNEAKSNSKKLFLKGNTNYKKIMIKTLKLKLGYEI